MSAIFNSTEYYVYDLNSGKLLKTCKISLICAKMLGITPSTLSSKFKGKDSIVHNNFLVEKDSVSMKEIEREVGIDIKKTTYTVSKRRYKARVFRTVAEVAKFIKATDSSIASRLQRSNIVSINGFTIKRDKAVSKEKLLDECFSNKLAEISKNRTLRTKQIREQALTRQQFEEEILKEAEDKRSAQKKWEEHCRECCTRSIDGKFDIPNSLLEEFPQLAFMTYPKSMS